jgi:hypothetical protein
MAESPQKNCTRCKVSKNEDDFSPAKWAKALTGYKVECRRCQKDRNFISLYGIGIDTWEEWMEKQKHCCYLCLTDFKNLQKDVHVDHNHVSGAVRALLCLKCNVSVGMWREDGSLAIKFMKYVKEFGEWNASENDVAELQSIFGGHLEISPIKVSHTANDASDGDTNSALVDAANEEEGSGDKKINN